MPSAHDRKGYLLIGSVAAVLVALLAARVILGKRPVPDAYNCVGEPSASTVMVFDRSEGIAAQTLDEMKARAAEYIRDSVSDNERVTIFTVDDSSGYALRPVMSLCRPPNSGSELTENVRLIKKRYADRFQRPIDSALSHIAGNGRESPIAQALTDIALSQYLGSPRNTLLVFSDLLENTNRFSLYKCVSPGAVVQEFKATRVGARERPMFRNTHVYLNVIPRLDYPAVVSRCRDAFWPWFFGDDSGPNAGVDVAFLPGGSDPPPRP